MYHKAVRRVKSAKPGYSDGVGEFTQTEDPPMTPEQVMARLNQMRKDFDDDKESEEYQALTHALLFVSYNLAAFKKYLEEANKKGT